MPAKIVPTKEQLNKIQDLAMQGKTISCIAKDHGKR